MGINSSKKQERVIEIKPSFLVILFSTLALLIGLVVALFVVMNIENKDVDDSPSKPKGPSKTTQTATPVSKTPLFPTKESRSSYKITTSESVVTLTDNSFITSEHTVLVKVDKDSLTSIVEKNADTQMYPASMTKVMTLLVACENLTDLDELLTIKKEHIDYVTLHKGSKTFFDKGDPELPGEKISVKDALYLCSYESDTIACLLLAEHIAGSEADFVELMNKKAESIGLTGTKFVNCTGLHDDNHYSTCKDMASIMAYAMDNELAKSILFSIESYSFKSDKFYTTKDPTKKLTYYPYYPYWYEDENRFNKKNKLETVTVVAGKTGWDEGGMSLVSVAKGNNDELYINVIVGGKDKKVSESTSTTEVIKIYNTYAK